MKPSDEYELLVRELAARLALLCKEVGRGEVRGGKENRILGASGFSHQVDVSIHFSRHLVLLECKRFKRPVDVSHALTFATRLHDIREAQPGTSVSGSLVSTKPVTSGAIKIAKHFNFSIVQVTTPMEYVLTIVRNHFVAKHESLVVSDRAEAHVIRRGD